jgi:hypothetical protein
MKLPADRWAWTDGEAQTTKERAAVRAGPQRRRNQGTAEQGV